MKLSKIIDRSLKAGNKFFMAPITSRNFDFYTTSVDMPECWEKGKFLASHIAFEEEADLYDHPYVESHDHKRCYIFDKKGNVMGHSDVICIDTTWYKGEDYRDELSNICQDIDDRTEDLSDLFFHKWVQKLPKENEIIVFLKGIYLEPKYIGKGIGTWFLGATLENAIGFSQKNITVALMVSPKDLDREKEEELCGTDSDTYKAASTKLLNFYKKSFKDISLIDTFKDCTTEYRVDTSIKSVAAIVVWTTKRKIRAEK